MAGRNISKATQAMLWKSWHPSAVCPMEDTKQMGKHETGDGRFRDWFAAQ